MERIDNQRREGIIHKSTVITDRTKSDVVKTIGIDIDEVIAHFLLALIKFHNNRFGTNFTYEQFKSYSFWEIWGGTKEEAIQKVYDFFETKYFRDIEPVEGSQEVMSILKENNKLIVITSRQNDIRKATLEWLEQFFPDTFSDVYFGNHYGLNGTYRTKAEICEDNNVDILIEDSMDYALECKDSVREVILLDRPWNDSITPSGIRRVQSWKEILNIIQ